MRSRFIMDRCWWQRRSASKNWLPWLTLQEPRCWQRKGTGRGSSCPWLSPQECDRSPASAALPSRRLSARPRIKEKRVAIQFPHCADDEISHHRFLNNYLVSKGAQPIDLNPQFAVLP